MDLKPPKIEDRLDMAKRLLEDWQELKDSVDDAIVSKRLDVAEQQMRALAGKIVSFYLLFRRGGFGTNVEYSPRTPGHRDWRSNEALTGITGRLFRRHVELEKAIETKDLASFIKQVDKCESLMQQVINKVKEMLVSGMEDPEHHVKEEERWVEQYRTNREKLDVWKRWVKEKAGQEIKDKSREELFEIIKGYKVGEQ